MMDRHRPKAVLGRIDALRCSKPMRCTLRTGSVAGVLSWQCGMPLDDIA